MEITGGLMPGEKVVVAGNFLIDSESRMKTAATGNEVKMGRDPDFFNWGTNGGFKDEVSL